MFYFPQLFENTRRSSGDRRLFDFDQSSNRKFAKFQLEEQARISERQAAEFDDALTREKKNLDEIANVVQTAIKSLQEATEINAEATKDIGQRTQELIDEQNKELVKSNDTLAFLENLWQRLSDRLDTVLGLGQNHSAGGLIGRQLQNGHYVSGAIDPTGSIKLHVRHLLTVNGTQYVAVPEGWVYCDGAYQNIKNYPELYSVIGIKFGALTTNGGGTFFKVPAKTDLTADATVLANAELQYIIRT